MKFVQKYSPYYKKIYSTYIAVAPRL